MVSPLGSSSAATSEAAERRMPRIVLRRVIETSFLLGTLFCDPGQGGVERRVVAFEERVPGGVRLFVGDRADSLQGLAALRNIVGHRVLKSVSIGQALDDGGQGRAGRARSE